MASDFIDSPSNRAIPKSNINDMDLNELFTHFSEKAWDVSPIMNCFELIKSRLDVEDVYGMELYKALKSKLTSWKAKSLWEMLDKKAHLEEYKHQKACNGMNVVIVGCGPVGMRLAIECNLLGCDVVIVEKRPYFSRNNVLHVWPFTIDDLKRLGAKKFYGMFCAGAIDHISIRTLQSILLKVCLLLGIKIYFNVEFIQIKEPESGRGWHGEFNPPNHEINRRDFQVLVGAEGKTSRIPGFDRKELRAKLALAITANFVNHRSQEEAAVQEISGVAFIFNQKFFKDLREDTGIDLENLVYYKDDTHYFIMTAKKDSLLDKGVLKQDFSDVNDLLHPSNRNVQALYDYACEAADWSTELPELEFAKNHKNIPDVDIFDFTSIYQAEYAAKALRRNDKDLLLCLVGDSLVQPFWPQGTGCARGFLSAMDAAWMIRGLGQKRDMLELLAERESLYQRLTQTTSETMMKKFSAYTIDPRTRYSNLNIKIVKPANVKHLYDFDGMEPLVLETTPSLKENAPPIINIVSPESPKNHSIDEKILTTPPKSSRSINEKGGVTRALYGTPEAQTQLVDKVVLINWFQEQVRGYALRVNDLGRSFRNGLVLCAVIHRYNPELIPEYTSLRESNPLHNNKLAFSLAEEHYGIQQLIKPSEMAHPDKLAMFTYLSNFYEVFQELELPEKPNESIKATPPAKPPRRRSQKQSSHYQRLLLTPPSTERSWNTQTSTVRRNLSPRKLSKKEKKRKENETLIEKEKGKEDVPSLDIVQQEKSSEESKRQLTTQSTVSVTKSTSNATPMNTSNATPKSTSNATPMKTSNATPKSTSNATPMKTSNATPMKTSNATPMKTYNATPKSTPVSQGAKRSGGSSTPRPVSTFGAPTTSSDVCVFCGKKVYLMERMSANGVFFHRYCFRCSHCNTQLTLGHYAMSKGESGELGKFFCKPHYRQLFLSNPEAINYARTQPSRTEETKQEEPPLTPPGGPLTTIGEDEITQSPEVVKDSEDDKDEDDEDEVVQTQKRKRTLTQRLSAIWKRRSTKSKSRSHDKLVSKESDVSIVITSPPTSPITSSTLIPTIEEPSLEEVKTKDLTEYPLPPFRARSPPLLGRPGGTPPPSVEGSPISTLTVRRKKRGQKSIVRPLLLDQEDEIAIEERHKQQERFREAQSIQREMSQIELQYEELEDIARDVEQNLRDAEETEQEEGFMKAWLNLVSERNILVRRTQELSIQMKVLELEDRQCEIEKTMRDLQANEEFDETQFDGMLQELVEVIDERDNIVKQVEQDRVRELEEEESQSTMMSSMFAREDDSPSRQRRSSAPVDMKEPKNEKRPKRSSWWNW